MRTCAGLLLLLGYNLCRFALAIQFALRRNSFRNKTDRVCAECKRNLGAFEQFFAALIWKIVICVGTSTFTDEKLC